MVRRAAVAAALLATITACSTAPHGRTGTEERPGPTPSGSTSPTAEPETEAEVSDPAEARRVFRQARRALALARTGGFYTDFLLPAGPEPTRVRHEGSYDLAPLRSDYTVTVDSPEGPLRTQVRSARSDAWFALLELPGAAEQPARCWIHLDLDVVSDVTQVDIPAGPGLGFPPEILGVLTGRVDDYDTNGALSGTTDLYTAATLFSGRMPFSLGIPVRSRDRVPVTFQLEGGELTGWSVDLADVVREARRAGHLPRPVRRELRRSGPAAFEARVDVELERTGEAWTYRPPPPDRTIEMSLGGSFETAMRSCTGVGQSGA